MGELTSFFSFLKRSRTRPPCARSLKLLIVNCTSLDSVEMSCSNPQQIGGLQCHVTSAASFFPRSGSYKARRSSAISASHHRRPCSRDEKVKMPDCGISRENDAIVGRAVSVSQWDQGKNQAITLLVNVGKPRHRLWTNRSSPPLDPQLCLWSSVTVAEVPCNPLE